MMGDQKGSSKMIVLLAIVTLLSFCNPASSFAFLPRVSRTDDAVIVDFEGGYAPSYQGKTLYGQITNPRFVPVPSFNPYPVVYRQQEQQPSGWSYSYGYPSPITVEDLLKQTPPAPPVCGTGPATMPASRELTSERIAPAGTAKKNAWPFIVALKKGDALICSGTLISDTRVLLAAQCLEKMSLYEFSGVTVLVGMFLTDKSDVVMTRRISKMFLHRQYNAATYANDIAIIVMDSPVVLSKTVATVCLPAASTDPEQFADQDAIILGWGGGAPPDTPGGPVTPFTNLQQAKVQIWSNSECKGDPTLSKFVSDTTLCLSNTDKFTCTEDVGGPVVILSAPGTWTIVGINSYTKDCKTTGLKTRVPAFRTWIDQYLTMA